MDFAQWLKEPFASLVKVLRKNADLLKKKKKKTKPTSSERYQAAKILAQSKEWG